MSIKTLPAIIRIRPITGLIYFLCCGFNPNIRKFLTTNTIQLHSGRFMTLSTNTKQGCLSRLVNQNQSQKCFQQVNPVESKVTLRLLISLYFSEITYLIYILSDIPVLDSGYEYPRFPIFLLQYRSHHKQLFLRHSP